MFEMSSFEGKNGFIEYGRDTMIELHFFKFPIKNGLLIEIINHWPVSYTRRNVLNATISL